MKITFCLNDIQGGVQSVVESIIRFAKLESYCNLIITVNIDSFDNKHRIKEISFPIEIKRFKYQIGENFYCIARRFKSLIDENDILVANDWLELCAASNLGLKNKIIYILHGDYDYYYNLALNHQNSIDAYVCVSELIEKKLKDLLPKRTNDIIHLRHPIPNISGKTEYNYLEPLRCLFIGRLTLEKGYNLLPKINDALCERGILVEWGIAGEFNKFEHKTWKNAENVKFLGHLPNSNLLTIIRQYDLFLLPSRAEGFPVSLVEAMKAGLVPLVSNLPSGIPELVNNGITGYCFALDDIKSYVNQIIQFHQNRNLLEKMGSVCQKKANEQFNPQINAEHYKKLFIKISELPIKIKPREKICGNRLDQPILPNSFVKIIRRLLRKKSNYDYR